MSANGLVSVAVYERSIGASVERIWENVLDWEHLPGLHRAAFASIRCLRADENGWRARLATRAAKPGEELEIEVRLERDRLRYVTATVAGAGAGTEIWTSLSPREPHATDIRVEFLVPGVAPETRAAVGRGYVSLYARLWDEDEAMMQRRESVAAQRALPPRGTKPLELGPVEELRARLPLVVELDGRRLRIVSLGETLVAHPTVCPHWHGPLEDAPLEGDTIECPWHRWRFDVRTGRSCDGRNARLAPAARVRVDARGFVSLSWC
jgi:nitrite reductase/ring-hydroxylating ferredoxin subunit